MNLERSRMTGTGTMIKWKYPLSGIDLGEEEEREVLKTLR